MLIFQKYNNLCSLSFERFLIQRVISCSGARTFCSSMQSLATGPTYFFKSSFILSFVFYNIVVFLGFFVNWLIKKEHPSEHNDTNFHDAVIKSSSFIGKNEFFYYFFCHAPLLDIFKTLCRSIAKFLMIFP